MPIGDAPAIGTVLRHISSAAGLALYGICIAPISQILSNTLLCQIKRDRESMDRRFSLSLPSSVGGNQEIETTTSLLFVGANGSGKTRLGTWIELQSPQKEKVHRISAQKSLTMPDTTTPMSIDRAEKDLLFGNADGQWAHKQGHRWQSKPAISLLNDYQKLMVYLFSDHTEESAKYLSASKASSTRIEPPVTKLDLVKSAWERVLPHRELVLGGLRIQTKVSGTQDKIYNSSEMSDGERVIFYLIGQCLAAPNEPPRVLRRLVGLSQAAVAS